jgi:toxin ParE1/3/4
VARFKLTKVARRDLAEIAAYTLEEWGDEQRVRYMTQLDARMRWIARSPQRGVSIERVRPGYWRASEGRHVIFYRVVEKRVEIMRVLHERMLPKRHL